MSGLFKIVGKDGKVTYSDVPAAPDGGDVKSLRPDGREKSDTKTKAQKDYATAKKDIALTRKHIPNLVQYLDYLEYLRHHNPIGLDRMLAKLRQEDPEVWLKLQKYPQFQPLLKTVGVSKAGGNLLAAGVGVASGNFSGSVEKWGENTLKDLMKRDGFYTDVLGSKASTLPAPPKRVFSNSKLGQYLAQEVPKEEAASKAVAKEVEVGRAALRTGAATAFSRVGGSVLDVQMAVLNPEVWSSIAVITLKLRMNKLQSAGVLDITDDAPQNLLSQGKYVELQKLMDDAETKYRKGQ